MRWKPGVCDSPRWQGGVVFDGGGGGQPQTTTSTTTTEMSPEQRQLMRLVIPQAEGFVQSPPQLFPNSAIAGFDPLQLAGQQMTVNAATGLLPQQVQNATNTSQFLSGPVLFPESNPALAAATEAAIRPVMQNFTQQILPNIRGGAITAGGYGGSRHGIAEGLASQAVTQKAGDISSTIAAQAYQQGLDAMVKTLGMQPQLAQMSLLPGMATEAVGAQRRAFTQAQLSEQASRFVQEQIMPFLAAQEVAKLAYGMPGGSSTTTGTYYQQQPQTSPLQYLMGGLSLAGALFSDMKVKRDIRFECEKNGFRLYSFRYVWSPRYYVGVLAQEVERIRPDAVSSVFGIKFVNYRKLKLKLWTLDEFYAYIV